MHRIGYTHTPDFSPFQAMFAHDIFQHRVIAFLEVRDVFCIGLICKLWSTFVSSTENSFWKGLFIDRGIPLVEGERDNYKADFKILYKMTSVSKRKIDRFLGKMIEEVPLISKERFEWLDDEDPWDRSKRIQDTFECLVVPFWLQRLTNRETPLVLDQGTLKAVSSDDAEEKTLFIPLTSDNLEMLSSYPLEGKENLPVFSKDDFFKQPPHPAPYVRETSVYFMRKEIIGRGQTLFQKDLVENARSAKGGKFEMTPFFMRMWAHVHSILEHGTCLDDLAPVPDDPPRKQLTYTRFPETVNVYGRECHLIAGRPFPSDGLSIFTEDVRDPNAVGVAPGFSAKGDEQG
jgi:hypothetical protein